ncbi:MAG TPA: hypothetical protein VGB14_18965 [Acidimicrobiales bacterium]|jgi:hypothetical protein
MSDDWSLGATTYDAVCQMEGHNWRGGGACVNCGARLRCACGQFVTENGIAVHTSDCRWVARNAA